jgi:hypothetical protein
MQANPTAVNATLLEAIAVLLVRTPLTQALYL